MFAVASKFLAKSRMRSLLLQLIRRVSYVQGQSRRIGTREYFYYIDHQGQLFLDDAKLKNFITCFKDKKFLEFFFKRVKPNNTGQYEDDFPYVSPCGRETNYIRCDDLPVVFSHLLAPDGSVVQDIAGYGGEECGSATEEGDGSEGWSHRDSEGTAEHDRNIEKDVSRRVKSMCPESTPARSGSGHHSHKTVLLPTASLAYGGTHMLTVPFQPSKLCMLPASGRVYHAGPERLGGVGLVKSSLAIELSRFFMYEEGAGESGHPVGFRWRGRTWELDGTVLDQLAHTSAGSE